LRVLADIPENDLRTLAGIAARRGVSRAALIREAVSNLIASKSEATGDDAFGLWGAGDDGLAIQDRLRSEW
jgi:hypothetical protein